MNLSAPGTGTQLPPAPHVEAAVLSRIERAFENFAEGGLPRDCEAWLLDEFQCDVLSEYAGRAIRNPFGKASGQLSMNLNQVREDIEAGLGFVVLKTVIAEDASGDQSMKAWAVQEARMDVEPITSSFGETGWTVTWKGRGWWQSFEDYLRLVGDSVSAGAAAGTLIVPSCKFHLPSAEEPQWHIGEYDNTMNRLLSVWQQAAPDDWWPMPLEKDFSPTLAGSDLAAARAAVLNWIRETPRLIREAASKWRAAGSQPNGSHDSRSVTVGLKLFNALFGDEFQVQLLEAVHTSDAAYRPDYLIWGNRLFDPQREFDGHRGVAYGGPDLSDRNLRVMNAFRSQCSSNFLPWSATGNITTGKMAVEYLLLGATSFQMHTLFQLPASEYRMKKGSRTQRALHQLYLHPQTGLIVWLEHLRRQQGRTGTMMKLSDFIPRDSHDA